MKWIHLWSILLPMYLPMYRCNCKTCYEYKLKTYIKSYGVGYCRLYQIRPVSYSNYPPYFSQSKLIRALLKATKNRIKFFMKNLYFLHPVLMLQMKKSITFFFNRFFCRNFFIRWNTRESCKGDSKLSRLTKFIFFY